MADIHELVAGQTQHSLQSMMILLILVQKKIRMVVNILHMEHLMITMVAGIQSAGEVLVCIRENYCILFFIFFSHYRNLVKTLFLIVNPCCSSSFLKVRPEHIPIIQYILLSRKEVFVNSLLNFTVLTVLEVIGFFWLVRNKWAVVCNNLFSFV